MSQTPEPTSLSPSKKKYISGYAGYRPREKFNNIFPRNQVTENADIPGYSGYVWAYEPENIYGKTFGRVTNLVKCTDKYRDRENLEDKAISICKESYIDPGIQDGKHNQIPTTKKFRIRKMEDYHEMHDMAYQCRKRIMDNFHQSNIEIEEKSKAEKIKAMTKPDYQFLNKPVVGYGAHNRQVYPANIHRHDWQICRGKAANQIKKNYKNLRKKAGEEVSKNTSKYEHLYNSYDPVVGYKGFVKRIEADNLFGRNYHDTLSDSKKSSKRLDYWKNREMSMSIQRFPSLSIERAAKTFHANTTSKTHTIIPWK